MKARLIDIPARELWSTIRDLSEGGFDEELANLVRKPGNAVMAVGAMRQKLLASNAVVSVSGRVIDISDKVEMLIKAGYHQAAGLSASAYRKLWPRTVTQPVEYAGRFDEVLLVDRTIAKFEHVNRGNIYAWVDPASCTNLAPVVAASRYIAFVQLGKKNLGRPVEDCTKTFASDEVGLVTIEGLHLPVQHAAYLRHYAVDLAGSRYGSVSAPYVSWFDGGRPGVGAGGVRGGGSHYGSASRGSTVITVS